MLADILHRLADQFPTEESHPYSPRPSLAGPERCVRQLDYYSQNYPRKPFPGRFLIVLEDSTIHEMLIKDWIQKSAFSVHSEQMRVVCGHVNGKAMNGHIDGIITDMFGADRLIEIKALSHFGFQDIWNGALPLDYITQTCLYLRGLKESNPDICEALLFIKNKNQAQYLEILIRYDLIEADTALIIEMVLSTGEKRELNVVIDHVTNSAIERFKEIEKFQDEKKLHNRQYKRDSWRCEYCPYGQLCWEGWEEEFEARDETSIILGEEEETLCWCYKESGAHKLELENEHKKLGEKIKDLMATHNAKIAQAGEYIIKIRLQSKKGIDETRIPPAILEQARTVSTFEVLNVNRPKSK